MIIREAEMKKQIGMFHTQARETTQFNLQFQELTDNYNELLLEYSMITKTY